MLVIFDLSELKLSSWIMNIRIQCEIHNYSKFHKISLYYYIMLKSTVKELNMCWTCIRGMVYTSRKPRWQRCNWCQISMLSSRVEPVVPSGERAHNWVCWMCAPFLWSPIRFITKKVIWSRWLSNIWYHFVMIKVASLDCYVIIIEYVIN